MNMANIEHADEFEAQKRARQQAGAGGFGGFGGAGFGGQGGAGFGTDGSGTYWYSSDGQEVPEAVQTASPISF